MAVAVAPPAPAQDRVVAALPTVNTGSAARQGRSQGGAGTGATDEGFTNALRSVGFHRSPSFGSISPDLFHAESVACVI